MRPSIWALADSAGPTVSVALQVRSRTAINGSAAARMINGRQHFAITFPQNHDAFNIGTIGTPSSGGTREIRVRFTPAEIGPVDRRA